MARLRKPKIKVSQLPRRLRRQHEFYPRPLRFKAEFKGGVLTAFSEKNPDQNIWGVLRPGNLVFIQRINTILERQGFGTNMVKYFLAKCKEQGIESAVVEAYTEQVAFWKKLGFLESPRHGPLTTIMTLTLGAEKK